MEIAYQPELWRDLFVMIGTSAGALVGLLFIVLSIHFDKIDDLADHNMRATIEGARFNTIHLLTVLVEAAVVLMPQPAAFLGAELIVINFFGLRLPLSIIYKYYDKHLTISRRGGFPALLIATIITAYLLGAGGGALLCARRYWGLYLVTISCLTKLVRSVMTAWTLILGVRHAARAAPQ